MFRFFRRKKKVYKKPDESSKSKVEPIVIDHNKVNNKILICDDSSTNRMVLRRLLEIKGYEIEESVNGEDAINKVLENGEYKIIWIDIQMPIMDGYTCTSKLRNEMQYSGPIIGVTGYVDPDSFKKCIDVGMTHVISKPIDRQVLYMYTEKYVNDSK